MWLAQEECAHVKAQAPEAGDAPHAVEAKRAAALWHELVLDDAPPTLSLAPVNAVLAHVHLSRFNDYNRIHVFYQLLNYAVTFEARMWNSKVGGLWAGCGRVVGGLWAGTGWARVAPALGPLSARWPLAFGCMAATSVAFFVPHSLTHTPLLPPPPFSSPGQRLKECLNHVQRHYSQVPSDIRHIDWQAVLTYILSVKVKLEALAAISGKADEMLFPSTASPSFPPRRSAGAGNNPETSDDDAMLRGSDSESSDAGQADAQPRAAEART